jgi:hypothetical protein
MCKLRPNQAFDHKAFVHVPCALQDHSSGMHVGLLMGGGGRLLGTAIIMVLVTIVWTLGHMIPFFFGLRMLGLLRVAEEEEMLGLDMSHHGGSAYRGNSRGGTNVQEDVEIGGKAGSVPQAFINRIVKLESQNVDLERQLTSMRVSLNERLASAVPAS